MIEAIEYVYGPERWNDHDVFAGPGIVRWLRAELDRDTDVVDGNFAIGLGGQRTPLQLATHLAQEEDRTSLAILDAGCGTGHTLRTLTDRLVRLTQFPAEGLRATGLSAQDFSGQSKSRRTREAIESGSVEYEVGDIRHLPSPAVTENSFDVVYAYESLITLPRPEDAIDRLLRVTRPAGHLLVTVAGESASRINTMLHKRTDQGYTFTGHVAVIVDDNYRTMQNRAFYHIQKPA